MNKPTLTELMEVIEEEGDCFPGYCIDCWDAHDGIEPDAEKCPCDACGKDSVYGAEQILLMGLCS